MLDLGRFVSLLTLWLVAHTAVAVDRSPGRSTTFRPLDN